MQVAKIVYQSSKDQAVICPHCEHIHIVKISESSIYVCETQQLKSYRINGSRYSLHDIAKALVSRDKMIKRNKSKRDIAKDLIRGESKSPS